MLAAGMALFVSGASVGALLDQAGATAIDNETALSEGRQRVTQAMQNLQRVQEVLGMTLV